MRRTAMADARPQVAIVAAALLALAASGAQAQDAHTPAPVGMGGHEMLEDPFNRSVLFEQLEVHDADEGTASSWDLSLWAGRTFDRLAVRSEGSHVGGSTERAELQLLWAHAFARWWDVVAGAREDFAPGDSRGWAAFGVQGLAPYRFDFEATAFVGDGGDGAARIDARYEILITRRWILQPRAELNWYGQDDAQRRIGAGLSNAELALRLRYEVRREVAPYVGLVSERKYGATADFARADGRDPDDTRVVAGVRVRF
jgi:copper resistance protein B